MTLHPLLERQLADLSLDKDEVPSVDQLRALLMAVSRAYEQADHDRRSLEHAFAASSHAEGELRAAKEAAERANLAKSDFLSNMSHEMRTPLNSVVGFARVLERGAYGTLNDRQREYVRHLVHAGEHMLNLVNDLLDLRRLEQSASGLDIEPIDIKGIIEESLGLVQAMLEEKRHTLTIAVPPNLPKARADRRAVVQILVNLLSNAIKYTPPGGAVTVRAFRERARILIEVEDTGIGVAEDDQSRLFTYFEQLGGKHAHHMKGSGIGLALTRSLVEKLGGTISVDSALGRGSRFSFTLPPLFASSQMSSVRVEQAPPSSR